MCCTAPLQAFEEFDEEVQEAEEVEARALSGGGATADRDDEVKPFVHRCARMGVWGRRWGGGARHSLPPLACVLCCVDGCGFIVS